jgi:hypothetical protein
MRTLLKFASGLIENTDFIEKIEIEPRGYSILFNDPTKNLNTLKGVLNTMLSVWTMQDFQRISEESGRLYFKVSSNVLADYKKGTEANQNNKITENPDGTIDVELTPWEFSCMPKQMESLISVMPYAENLQIYSWTTLIGLFLAEPDFAENELLHSDKISGRWIIKGCSPFGQDHYFEFHDIKGGDIAHIYAQDGYGIYDLFEWVKEHFADRKAVEYIRRFKLPDGETGSFGINDKGEKWHSWDKIPPWLKELGLG